MGLLLSVAEEHRKSFVAEVLRKSNCKDQIKRGEYEHLVIENQSIWRVEESVAYMLYISILPAAVEYIRAARLYG